MFELALPRFQLPAAALSRPYPELDHAENDGFEALLYRAWGRMTGYRAWIDAELERVPARVEHAARRLDGQDDLRQAACHLQGLLRRQGLTPELVDLSFAVIRALAQRTLGMRHFDVQLMGGYALLKGVVAEMETGEGKTLTGTLAAGTVALAGVPVHVVTVNDYLARRDAADLRPLFSALGLTVGVIQQGMSPQQRRAAYACDITYCSNKELAFDYLKDRVKGAGHKGPLHAALNKLAEPSAAAGLLLRGLQFAIVDEADSVLIDEARTPLILSSGRGGDPDASLYREALRIAQGLGEADWQLIEKQRQIQLLPGGQASLERLARDLTGLWTSRRWREEFVTRALTALHCYRRDVHYIVSDGKVQIVDEYTGRVMPDRAWEHGLHQLIESKEGCEVTGQRHTIARVTYQRFFRRYLRLSGMTGTAQEVKRELWEVYRLPVVRIATHRPSQRRHEDTTLCRDREERWKRVADAIQRARNHEGRPLLVGTRSVAASEHLSALLMKRGLEHVVLNARDEAVEADIVSRAGQPDRITVSTNMAGRGTDIKLAHRVAAAGGLKVILTEFHESPRIDRQLFGRCARQGEPGSYLCFASLDDDLFVKHAPRLTRLLVRRIANGHTPSPRMTRWFIRWCQFMAECENRQVRMHTLETDKRLDKMLAFSPHSE
jgi:preprotein translocase subunit SecA